MIYDKVISEKIREIDLVLEKLTVEQRLRMWGNNSHPKKLDFEKTIGNTTYIVTSHFNLSASEDMVQKIERMLRED